MCARPIAGAYWAYGPAVSDACTAFSAWKRGGTLLAEGRAQPCAGLGIRPRAVSRAVANVFLCRSTGIVEVRLDKSFDVHQRSTIG
jgi:hypothetical protein